ncbi:MAG: Ig-like domain-containing protein [Pseudomonadota bacterium]
MSNYAGFTVLGAPGENERAGREVAIIGDINGDGIADFAVAAPQAEVSYDAYYGEIELNFYNAGKVYVVFGDSDTDGDGPDAGLPLNINVEDLDGTNGFVIEPDRDLLDRFGFGYYGEFGSSIVGLGDVNGDGVDDFGIAQSSTSYGGFYGYYGEGGGYYGPGQGSEGVAYVILGGQEFAPVQEVDDLAGFRIDAEGAVLDIINLGDVNGDGFNDIGVDTVDRLAGNYYYIDFYYLQDDNGNGVYDPFDPDDPEPVFEFYYNGSIRASVGQSTSFVVFGTDLDRVSDPAIATGGGGGGPVLLDVTSFTVPDDAPTIGETIVNTTLLDGGDGFSIDTGRTLTTIGYYGPVDIGSSYDTGGIAGVGDINGDGIDDIVAARRGYYNSFLPTGVNYNETLTIIQTDGGRDISGDYYTSNASYGEFFIFGNAAGDGFPAQVNAALSDPEVEFQVFLGQAVDVVGAGVGDASGNDDIDDFVINDTFLGGETDDFDVITRGVTLISGTTGEFFPQRDGAPAGILDYDLEQILNDGRGAFITDSTSGLVGFIDDAPTPVQFGFFASDIVGLGDVSGDGIADFAVLANRNDLPPGATSNAPGRSAVYLVFGQADPMTGVIDLADTFGANINPDQRLGFRIEGFENNFTDSLSISGLGDVSGDGVNDIIIGDGNADGQSFSDGVAYVVFGGTAALGAADEADGTNDGVIDIANLGVNVDTGELPIEVSVRNSGFFSQFLSEGDVGATIFTFTVDRTGDLTEEVSFDFAVTPSGFDPAEEDDFVLDVFPSGNVTFDPGASSVDVEIEVQGDFTIENTEDFTFTISNAATDGDSPISITPGADASQARIFNDDFPVRFRANNASVTEGNEPGDARVLVLSVSRSGEIDVEASVDFQISNVSTEADDFEAGVVLEQSGTLTFLAGETIKTFEFAIEEDFEVESSEQIRIDLSNASSPSAATVQIDDSVGIGTIINDDFPVQFFVSNAFVTEGDDASDARELVFTVTRSGNTAPAARVDLTFQSSSFRPADENDFEVDPFGMQTLDFAAFETSKVIRLAIDEDVDIEFDERIDALLSNARFPDGGTDGVVILDSFGLGTISNDDFPPRISVEGGGFLSEGTGPGTTTFTFEIMRTGDTTGITDVTFDLNPLPSQGDFFAADSQDISGISIDGTDVPGSGFLPLFGQTVRFEDGESSKTVEVDIIRDGIIEPRESFELRITEVDALNGVDYDIFTSARSATILNDDGRPPIIPPGVEADVFGDPHIVTLDGLGYDFQATGEYILVETLDGATNPFQVQVRFEPLPGSDLVSTTTRMAVQIGDATLEIDALGSNPLLITGADGTTRTPTVEELALGSADINGDGFNDVFFNADLSEFFVALNDLGPDPVTGDTRSEQLMVKNMDGTLNVCVFLSDLPGGNQGNVRGLMGDADGTGDTSDDLALREGTVVPVGSNLLDINGDAVPEDTPLTADTVLPQPVDFDTLYGIYAISWNLDGTNGKDSFFSDAPVPRDPDFPAALLTIDDLPDDVRAAAEAAVIAAQDPNDPLDQAVFEAAVLDFALTGNPDFISGALGLAAEQTAETEPENAPDLPVTISVSADPTETPEGDTGSQNVVFTFSRLDDASVPLSITYELGGTVDASDLAEGTEFSGTIDFDIGEDTKTITVEVLGDLTTEDDETLIATITDSGGALVAGATAEAIIATDDFAPVAQDDAFSTDEDTQVEGNVFDDNQAEDPEDNSDSDADNDDLTITSITQSDGATRLANGGLIILPSGAHLRINPDGSFTYDPFGFTVGLGSSNDTIFDQLGAGEVETETFTYHVTDGNGGTASAEVTINVQGINDAPVAVLDEFELTEDTVSVTGNVIQGDQVRGPDFDPEGDDLFVTQINGVNLDVIDEDATREGAQITVNNRGLLTINAVGDFVFETQGNYEFLGDDPTTQIISDLESFTYTLADDQGLTDTASLRFNISGVNDGPVAEDDEAFGQEDEDIVIDVLANDSDPDSDNVGIVASVGNIGPSNGSVVSDSEGNLVYTPDDNFFGTDEFSYIISDGEFTSEAIVTVNVAAVNDAPVAVDDEFTFAEDDVVNMFGVLTANDSDIDSDSFQISSVNGLPVPLDRMEVTSAGGRTALLTVIAEPTTNSSGATLDFVINPGTIDNSVLIRTFEDLGADEEDTITFSYVLNDGEDDSLPANVTVTIMGENDLPVALSAAEVSFFEDDNPIIITPEDLINEQTVRDVDNDLLELSAFALTCCPTISLNGDAIGIPDGLDGFEDFEIQITSAISGPDTIWTVAPGQFEFLGRNDELVFEAQYRVTDIAVEEALQDVENLSVLNSAFVTIIGQNDGPDIISDDAFNVVENTTAVTTVEAEDADLGDVLSFQISGGADAALFGIDAETGALNFVDAPDFEVPGSSDGDNAYQVEVEVSDGDLSDTQEITVTVVNDPTDDGGTGPLILEGTDGNDRLVGTAADEIIRTLAGAVDLVAGGGGSDTFEFGDETNNGVREITYLLDFGDDDFLNLNGTGFTEFNVFGRTYLVLEGDGDIALFLTTPDFDETTQLI